MSFRIQTVFAQDTESWQLYVDFCINFLWWFLLLLTSLLTLSSIVKQILVEAPESCPSFQKYLSCGSLTPSGCYRYPPSIKMEIVNAVHHSSTKNDEIPPSPPSFLLFDRRSTTSSSLQNHAAETKSCSFPPRRDFTQKQTKWNRKCRFSSFVDANVVLILPVW